MAHEIFSHIIKLRKDLGTTFIIVEHRLDLTIKYVDYIYAMDEGKIICEGKPEEVTSDKRVIDSYLGDYIA